MANREYLVEEFELHQQKLKELFDKVLFAAPGVPNPRAPTYTGPPTPTAPMPEAAPTTYTGPTTPTAPMPYAAPTTYTGPTTPTAPMPEAAPTTYAVPTTPTAPMTYAELEKALKEAEEKAKKEAKEKAYLETALLLETRKKEAAEKALIKAEEKAKKETDEKTLKAGGKRAIDDVDPRPTVDENVIQLLGQLKVECGEASVPEEGEATVIDFTSFELFLGEKIYEMMQADTKDEEEATTPNAE